MHEADEDLEMQGMSSDDGKGQREDTLKHHYGHGDEEDELSEDARLSQRAWSAIS
jgi:hypothetical protein